MVSQNQQKKKKFYIKFALSILSEISALTLDILNERPVGQGCGGETYYKYRYNGWFG